MRAIAVVTVGRSDYGIYQPLLRRLAKDPGIRLQILAAGMHLEPRHGNTYRMIEEDGYTIAARVPMELTDDSPAGIARSMGLGVTGFSAVFAANRPDLLVVLGDRFDMCTAPLAALPFKIPVAHLHGGEVTEGAIDDALRHCITKLSHLHFASTDVYARRIRQLGEESWRIEVSGAPGLDHVLETPRMTTEDLSKRVGLDLRVPTLLVTYHPVTLEYESAAGQTDALLAALEASGLPVVITKPNADTGNHHILDRLERFAAKHDTVSLVDNLGTRAYFTMMSLASAMVGNSSSGIIEAASFQLPVVNIGTRQKGRIRGANVIDCGYGSAEILAAVRKATSPGFRSQLKNSTNPYGDGHAAERIHRRLASVAIDEKLIVKSFADAEPHAHE